MMLVQLLLALGALGSAAGASSGDCTNSAVSKCSAAISTAGGACAGALCDSACSAQVGYARCLRDIGCERAMFEGHLDACRAALLHALHPVPGSGGGVGGGGGGTCGGGGSGGGADAECGAAAQPRVATVQSYRGDDVAELGVALLGGGGGGGGSRLAQLDLSRLAELARLAAAGAPAVLLLPLGAVEWVALSEPPPRGQCGAGNVGGTEGASSAGGGWEGALFRVCAGMPAGRCGAAEFLELRRRVRRGWCGEAAPGGAGGAGGADGVDGAGGAGGVPSVAQLSVRLDLRGAAVEVHAGDQAATVRLAAPPVGFRLELVAQNLEHSEDNWPFARRNFASAAVVAEVWGEVVTMAAPVRRGMVALALGGGGGGAAERAIGADLLLLGGARGARRVPSIARLAAALQEAAAAGETALLLDEPRLMRAFAAFGLHQRTGRGGGEAGGDEAGGGEVGGGEVGGGEAGGGEAGEGSSGWWPLLGPADDPAMAAAVAAAGEGGATTRARQLAFEFCVAVRCAEHVFRQLRAQLEGRALRAAAALALADAALPAHWHRAPPSSTSLLPAGASVTGFYHATGGSPVFGAVVDAQLRALRRGPLWEMSTALVASVLGAASDEQVLHHLLGPGGEKLHVALRSAHGGFFEAATLTLLKRFCDAPAQRARRDALVYYLHSKGVTRWHDAARLRRVEQWRGFMEYALFENPRRCIDALLRGNATTCGVNFSAEPMPHFAGNFWWARCDYVRELPDPVLGCWTCGEMWLNSAQRPPHAAVHNVWSTGADHYNEDFPRADWPAELLDTRL
jgi:hypothetical protein